MAFLPPPEGKQLRYPRSPAAARPTKSPTQVAEKSSPVAQEPQKGPLKLAERDQGRAQPDTSKARGEEKETKLKAEQLEEDKPDTSKARGEEKEAKLKAEQLEEDKPDTSKARGEKKESIVRRPLPTLKDLLPPVYGFSARGQTGDREGPIRLDSKEPKYVSFLTSVKQAIEVEWIYPEVALRHGLEGTLVLEFTILANGQLGGARLIRSSGYSVLDREAIRALQAASPFRPLPPWIGQGRLDIVATLEYHDNRLKYGSTP